MNATKLHSTLVEPGTVRLERLLPGPIERVWAYITESEKRAKWFAGGEWELRAGGSAPLHFDHASLSNDKVPPEKHKDKAKPSQRFGGRILNIEPMRTLTHTMPFDGVDTEVTYELTARGKDVLLVIVHRRLGAKFTTGVMGGWDVHTGILADVLNGVEPRPFWKTHAALEKEYAAAL
jgi:uncharacterized protein YndB with AHSA1/START domain